ncbi:hypothetical protein ONZ51_g10574 [Trametes cubensis]|uniref:Uncharacterized protein n=1 Tax=Trametes cubensis TaxID=1111947 RepID=A0AAD7TJS3_9APHY|nr:hypothetical protein ONZ51_g10574 [Trametes cubensis]
MDRASLYPNPPVRSSSPRARLTVIGAGLEPCRHPPSHPPLLPPVPRAPCPELRTFYSLTAPNNLTALRAPPPPPCPSPVRTHSFAALSSVASSWPVLPLFSTTPSDARRKQRPSHKRTHQNARYATRRTRPPSPHKASIVRLFPVAPFCKGQFVQADILPGAQQAQLSIDLRIIQSRQGSHVAQKGLGGSQTQRPSRRLRSPVASLASAKLNRVISEGEHLA